jgi:YebC/PmpR family DNA-binding regulatory protein
MGRAFEVRKAAMAKTSAAKTKVYSRFGKEIYMAAKAGVPDPEMNQSLKRTIEKAKVAQVPADIIKRAIEKAKGGSEESYTSVRYEGFGPNNSFIIVDCLTDNVNRTVSDVRTCFNKSKSKMGISGSVAHNFDHVGVLSFTYGDDGAMLDTLVEANVDVQDIEVEEGQMTVYVSPTDLYAAKSAIEALIPDVTFDVVENTMIPQSYVSVEGEDKELFDRLMSMLDAVDDVQEVYHNVQDNA